MTAIIIMFFVGIKDDILTISARMKFLAQLVAAFLLVIPGDIRFTNLHGVLGLYEIDYFMSASVSILAIIAITNAVNLIDGIDGLASSIGILAALAFGGVFYQMEAMQYAVISFATAGSLIVFFNFNVFSKKNKIFMGDTGSLIIGVIISVLVIQYNEFSLTSSHFTSSFSPTLSLAIVSLPLFDMLKVFFLRIISNKSPFDPDMNHIHHKLLRMGFSHFTSTLILISVNLFFIGFVFLINGLNINYQLLLLSALFTSFTFIPNFFIAQKRRQAGSFLEDQPYWKVGMLKRYFSEK
jgi:UDP-N-acetylmuramyl pentapeptide phosphotransferase/UDP-N-acetylglucosamine-1-phosphate transferase